MRPVHITYSCAGIGPGHMEPGARPDSRRRSENPAELSSPCDFEGLRDKTERHDSPPRRIAPVGKPKGSGPDAPKGPSSEAPLLSSTQRAASDLVENTEKALTALYERVTPAIHAYAALRLGNTWIGPEDIVAEVWFRVASRVADYDASRPFRAWVFGFAQRVVKEAQRRVARSASPREAASDSTMSSILSRVPASITSVSLRVARDEEARLFVQWARHELTEYEREVLLLRGIQGRPLAEVASALGRTDRAVTVCWSRVLEKVHARSAPTGVIEIEP